VSSEKVEARTVPWRSCGSCSLCCKVFEVEPLNKPQGQWCTHCLKPSGCSIHATRPKICRDFYCGWMCHAELGDEWFPRRCKMVLRQIPITDDERWTRISVFVDPSSPSAWRREPYFSQLKKWARDGMNGTNHKRQVVIYIGDRGVVLLPDKEVDLGVAMRHNIFVTARHTACGLDYDAYKEPWHEPRDEIALSHP
jgi:hypothetical protein